ncbi:FRG domain-containing protein [Arthrobacter gyeryongensis]|uniref:FRG domain-containing protein n=1 Tax=Arthrobacter gyeryongensis TaxID=1650592 RepID=UPI0031EADF39
MDLHLDPLHLNWILAATELDEQQRQRASSALSELRLEPLADMRPIGPDAPDSTWFTITGPDVLIDILIQPMAVLSSFIALMLDTWQKAVDLGIQTFWSSRLPDEAQSAIELFILRVWGLPIGLPSGVSHSQSLGETASLSHLNLDHVDDVSDLSWEKNPRATVNETAFLVVPPRVQAGLVDPFYGQVYSHDFLSENDSIYRARKLTDGTFGHLSVPFRTVPRYFADSADTLITLLEENSQSAVSNSLGDGVPLYRGQNREHTLQRSRATRLKLFGDAHAIEPSLLPSGTRRSTPAAAATAFNSLIESAVEISPEKPHSYDHETWSTFRGDNLKTSFAQHYGLATPSLDLTEDFLVACWFATTRLQLATPGILRASPVDDEDICVIYVLRPDMDAGAPIDVQMSPYGRPARQRGWVTTNTWGWRSNDAARHLEAAVYFEGRLRHELKPVLPQSDQLFVPQGSDVLMDLALSIGNRLPDSPITDALLRDLYRVVE